MFGMLISLEWPQLVRGALVTLAALMLTPGAVMGLAMLGLMLVPVALVAIPFMLVTFFEVANVEHHAIRDRSLMLTGAPAMAH